MEARRIELGIEWKDVASRADVSYETIRNLRREKRAVSALKTRRIEVALEWHPGSIDAVLNGGEPSPASPDDIDTLPPVGPATSREEAQPMTPVKSGPTDYPDDMELSEREKVQWQTLRDISPEARRRVIQYTRLERERLQEQEMSRNAP